MRTDAQAASAEYPPLRFESVVNPDLARTTEIRRHDALQYRTWSQ